MSDLTPEEEAEVTRLLASAAEPVTMPPSVSARLDDVLAGLVAERTESPAPQTLGEVIPIKHRRWPKVLMAAAAVGVFGYVGSGLLQQSGDDSSTSADSGASVQESAPSPSGSRDQSADEDHPAAAPPVPLDDPLLDAAAKSLNEVAGKSRSQRTSACPTPDVAGATAYAIRDQRLVVVLNRLGGNAARADIYPCGQTVFPVATRLLLDAR